MLIVFVLLLIMDVLLSIALLKLTERVNNLTDKVKHNEQVTNSKYDLLRKQLEDSYMTLNSRYNVHRMMHIMKGDKI